MASCLFGFLPSHCRPSHNRQGRQGDFFIKGQLLLGAMNADLRSCVDHLVACWVLRVFDPRTASVKGFSDRTRFCELESSRSILQGVFYTGSSCVCRDMITPW